MFSSQQRVNGLGFFKNAPGRRCSTVPGGTSEALYSREWSKWKLQVRGTAHVQVVPEVDEKVDRFRIIVFWYRLYWYKVRQLNCVVVRTEQS